MIATLSAAALAWLLTYLIHSTALLTLAWGLTRARSWSPASADLLWKTALIGGVLTATVQLRLELRPAGSVSLAHASPALASHPTSRVSLGSETAQTNAPTNREANASMATSPTQAAAPTEPPAPSTA